MTLACERSHIRCSTAPQPDAPGCRWPTPRIGLGRVWGSRCGGLSTTGGAGTDTAPASGARCQWSPPPPRGVQP